MQKDIFYENKLFKYLNNSLYKYHIYHLYHLHNN